jgi:hypothetical protein
MTADDGYPAGHDPDGQAPGGGEPDYHLLVAPEEVPVLRTALDLLIKDIGGDQQIRDLARGVLARLPAEGHAAAALDRDAGPEWPSSIPLQAPEMKIVHTAAHLLLDDLQREQADEIHILQAIIAKLPDEHAIRAISLD